MRIASILLAVSIAACQPTQNAGKIVIDCLGADQSQIETLIASLAQALVAAAPDWTGIEGQAITAGQTIGGCALAAVVQQYLTPTLGRAAPSPEHGRAARGILEHFRANHAGGATFRTSQGDL